MKLDTTPWARSALTADDRDEIARAEPLTGCVVLSRDGPGGSFRAALSHAAPMTVQQGFGSSPIVAFRDALAKVPA